MQGIQITKFSITILLMLALKVGGFSQEPQKPKAFEFATRFKITGYSQSKVCLSDEEYKLYRLIMDVRVSKGLPEIPLSKALTYVAQTHAADLVANYRPNNRCNIHSWSGKGKGKWTACCYTKDHQQAECMWSKPRELTPYQGDGFELAYMYSWTPTAERTLDYLLKSPSHAPVILNTGDWGKTTWKAIGIGMYGDYALVWLGKIADPDGEPKLKD